MTAPAQPAEPHRPGFGPADVIAGVTVALVLIPQSIAYAALAGLPPVYGIYAAALPPMAAAFFASSPYLQTGPVAMTSVLTFGALSVMAQPFSEQFVALAALLALVVGLSRIFVGAVRAGFVAYLMSEPILIGFTSAAAILIASSQLPTLLGVAAPGDGVISRCVWTLSHPGNWSPTECLIGAATLVCIFGGRRVHVLFPGVLVAVTGAIVYSRMSAFPGAVVGAVPTDFPLPSLDLPWHELPHLLVPGMVIALVGFAEPAAIARTIAAQTRSTWSADREFISQGFANLAAAASGTFPVGGSFSRSMINRSAGGRSRWSGFVTGFMVLVFIPFATILEPLPRAVPAAIVIAAVFDLMQFRALFRIFTISPPQAVIAWSTFALTLVLAPRIDIAVLIGIGMGVAVHLWRERRVLVNVEFDEQTRELWVEPIGVVFFGSAAAVSDSLLAVLADEPTATRLVIDLRKVGRIDYTGALVFKRVAQGAEAAGLTVHIIPGQSAQGPRVLERLLSPDSHWLDPPPGQRVGERR